MPIIHEGQTIWVECVAGGEVGSNQGSTPQVQGIMLDLDCSDLDVTGASRPQGTRYIFTFSVFLK